MHSVHPFEPILFDDTAMLILGSFPSLDSFKHDFYYAHPRNQFWRILSDIFEHPIETTDDKKALLKRYRIGLWDVVASCQRRNSSDANLKECRLNNIPLLLQHNPTITTLAFTGQKAAQLYRSGYANLHVNTQTLPSPSAAFASMKYNTKKEAYRHCFHQAALL